MMKNIFDRSVSEEVIERINKLTPETQPLWGKMNVAQVMAHCCVTYEFIYTDIHPKPGKLKRFLLKAVVKQGVVGEKPYKKNLRTAPEFIKVDEHVFEEERNRLISYIKKTQELGPEYFDGKESHSFGILNLEEWNNMFYKHLDHHLSQFGV
jgi:hypothetical protein